MFNPPATLLDRLYELLKYWLPILSGFLLVTKAFLSARKSFTGWADCLLNNHLSHIQTAVESSANSLKELSQANHQAAVVLGKVADDLHNHEVEDSRVQSAILTGIEVIKAKLP